MIRHRVSGNYMNEMSVRKLWNEICGRGKWENPEKKSNQTPLSPPRNPHGVTEARTRSPGVGIQAPWGRPYILKSIIMKILPHIRVYTCRIKFGQFGFIGFFFFHF